MEEHKAGGATTEWDDCLTAAIVSTCALCEPVRETWAERAGGYWRGTRRGPETQDGMMLCA